MGSNKPLINLALNVADRAALYRHYMPFIKHGGLFVPTQEKLQLHDTVILQLRLADEGKKLVIPGQVVWVTPGIGQRGTPPGVGIQFIGEHRQRIKQFIEDFLGEMLKQPASHPVY